MTDSRTHPLVVAETLALVGIGGFAGSNLRYFVGGFLPGPAGTLVLNVLGSLALGFLVYESMAGDHLAARTRMVVGTGFLSSLTTYSTFVVESLTADPPVGVAYVLGSYALGFIGVVVGGVAAARVSGQRVATDASGSDDDGTGGKDDGRD